MSSNPNGCKRAEVASAYALRKEDAEPETRTEICRRGETARRLLKGKRAGRIEARATGDLGRDVFVRPDNKLFA